MKNILLILTSALLFSCGGDTKKSLVGTWDVFENGLDFEATITFYNDGSALLEERGDQDMGEWRMAGDGTLLCIGDRQDELCGVFEWLDDNSFRFENENDWFIIRRKIQSSIEIRNSDESTWEDDGRTLDYIPASERNIDYDPSERLDYVPQSSN